jgi:cob(I)alamin adenosyltransferase
MSSEPQTSDGDHDGADTPPVDKPDRSEMRTASSLVLVNTGHGKGKSTAAFGTILRAVAQGWPVTVVQFLKSGDWNVGEEKVCRQLGVEWLAAGDGFTWDADDLDESRAMARGAWETAKGLLNTGEHRLLVLDEISYAMTWEWIDTAEVAASLVGRREDLSVILTGRDMPEAIVEVADTVTEMVKVKHAFDNGILAKKGIDY